MCLSGWLLSDYRAAGRGEFVTRTRNPRAPSGASNAGRYRTGLDKNRTQGTGGRFDHVYAALDLGTNNCRLLIARPDGDSFRVVDAFSRIVRLGEGIDETRNLSEAAMVRAVEALAVCAQKMQRRNVTRMRCIATEACRRAANGAEFAERVRRETGIDLDIIPANEEARLAVAGCAPLFDANQDCLLVFDIGGGSTEIVWIDLRDTPRNRRRDLLLGVHPGNLEPQELAKQVSLLAKNARWTSLPVGVVTLSERFGHYTDEQERFEMMRQHTATHIAPFVEGGGGASADQIERMQLLGTSGTITTLAGVHLNLRRYNRAQVDGLWIDRVEMHDLIGRLLSLSKEDRSSIPCIGDDRSELVISGSAILSAILDQWPADKLRVADRGLREGLLYGLMNREDALARGSKDA